MVATVSPSAASSDAGPAVPLLVGARGRRRGAAEVAPPPACWAVRDALGAGAGVALARRGCCSTGLGADWIGAAASGVALAGTFDDFGAVALAVGPEGLADLDSGVECGAGAGDLLPRLAAALAAGPGSGDFCADSLVACKGSAGAGLDGVALLAGVPFETDPWDLSIAAVEAERSGSRLILEETGEREERLGEKAR